MALYGTLDIPVVSMAFGPGAGYGHCGKTGPSGWWSAGLRSPCGGRWERRLHPADSVIR